MILKMVSLNCLDFIRKPHNGCFTKIPTLASLLRSLRYSKANFELRHTHVAYDRAPERLRDSTQSRFNVSMSSHTSDVSDALFQAVNIHPCALLKALRTIPICVIVELNRGRASE
jgi:hypothetical protein